MEPLHHGQQVKYVYFYRVSSISRELICGVGRGASCRSVSPHHTSWNMNPITDSRLAFAKMAGINTQGFYSTLSLFLQCSVHFFCFSLSSHISPLFPLPLQLLFSSSPLFVSLRFLHVDKALVSLFSCRMFWLLHRTAEYFVTPLENMDMKHVFPV